jgi:hypothetical protein
MRELPNFCASDYRDLSETALRGLQRMIESPYVNTDSKDK